MEAVSQNLFKLTSDQLRPVNSVGYKASTDSYQSETKLKPNTTKSCAFSCASNGENKNCFSWRPCLKI